MYHNLGQQHLPLGVESEEYNNSTSQKKRLFNYLSISMYAVKW